MRRGTVVAVVALLGLAGYAGADVLDLAPGVLTMAPLASVPVTTATPTATPSATLTLPSRAPSGMPVGPAGADGGLPSAAGLGAALGPVLADRAIAGASLAIRDGVTGAHLLDVAADSPRTPASTAKLLTALAVDATFPAGSDLVTSVVQGSAPDRIVLVAGGDSLLAPGAGDPHAVVGHAGLADLADAVADALRGQGRTSAVLQVDAAYASGPVAAASWPSSFLGTGITGPVATLGLGSHRALPDHPGSADPIGEVAATLAARLGERGISTSVDPAPVRADPAAVRLGEVRSAPVEEVLGLALRESDNGLTETLARLAAARAGRATDFPAVGAFVRERVAAAGIDVTGVSLVDASGLSDTSTMPARVLADVVALAASGRRPGLSAAFESLPIAGLTGTLADRFADPAAAAGVGLVRAKTGTLTGVNSLAGTVVTAEGRLLVFAVLAPGPTGTAPARLALDRIGATLATCGCR